MRKKEGKYKVGKSNIKYCPEPYMAWFARNKTDKAHNDKRVQPYNVGIPLKFMMFSKKVEKYHENSKERKNRKNKNINTEVNFFVF